MTPDERNMLLDLASKVSQMPPPQRDPEAEDLIRTQIGNRPDALYLMTQTVMIQNLALQRAQQQIQDLQSRAAQPQVASGGSWLGQNTPQPSYSQAPPQYSSPQPQSAPPPSSGFGGGGFLRGAAQTAAGVAAGTLAAEAIGSMFSHHGGGFFGGNEFAGGPGMAPTEEVVNNYYDSPAPGRDDRDNRFADNSSDDRFADSNAQDDNTQYDDNPPLDDNSQYDDSNFDSGDSNFDSGTDDQLA